MDFLISVIKTARPRQWLKNTVIFAALVFTGDLFSSELFYKSLWGFIALSALVSSVYFINDVADREHDKQHPFKQFRPIARGAISPSTALFLALVGISFGLVVSYSLSYFFFLALVSYLVLQTAYTFFLKQVIVLDILAIAAGFVLRIYGGAFLVNAHLSVWFLLCVVSLSLFLAAGKRRAELAILTENLAAKHRKTLSLYSPSLLDAYLAMFATASWVSWALFTFFEEREREFYISQAVVPHLLDDIPLTILGSGKLLMVTIPIVIFGVMRYLYIVYEGARAETPEKVIMSDKQLLLSVLVWGLTVLFVLYGIRPTG